MNEKHRTILDAIEMVAGLEAQRVALAAINQAVAVGLIPAQQHHVNVDVKIKTQLIALASGSAP